MAYQKNVFCLLSMKSFWENKLRSASDLCADGNMEIQITWGLIKCLIGVMSMDSRFFSRFSETSNCQHKIFLDFFLV